jgi:hypothetical protein
MQESKAHMENANFSVKNSDGLTVALNINATYNNNRKNYIIIHPPIIIIIIILLLLLLLLLLQLLLLLLAGCVAHV